MAKPKFRFPEFVEEWEEKQFSNIATISGGYAFDSKKMTSTPAKYQVVKMGNLYQGKLDLDRIPSFIENATEKELEYLIQKNDIGITLTGTVNKHDYGYSYRFGNEKNLLLNQRLGLIRAKQSVDAVFLSSIVKGKNFLTQFYNISTGGTGNQTNVSTKGIEKIMVSVPILKEQQKIADFLSSVDDLIQIQEEKIAALEEQKKGIMQKLFNREVRFKADDGSEYSEWEEKKLGECILIQRGGSPRPIESYMTNADDGINWIKIGDAPINGNIITSVKEKIKPEGKKKSREVFVGDLILSNSMSFGRPYILDVNGCIHDGWLLLRDEKKQFDLKYLCYLLSSNSVLLQYKKLAAGSAVNNLNSDLVQSVRINYPSKEEQKKIADCLSAYDEAIQIKKEKLEVWKDIKKGLLQQMFV